jgi:hypothetical protein
MRAVMNDKELEKQFQQDGCMLFLLSFIIIIF